MKAVEITEHGTPEVLKLCERPKPEAAHGEVVIKLAFAGVNRPDALQRAGLYHPPKFASDLPGLEGAGEVVQVGEGVTWPRVGDQVCALLPGGGYAQYVATPAVHCLPIPQDMPLDQAACLPENYFTVYSNIVTRGGLTAGERFLVHGGSSGIGTTAIQMANVLGARVFTTAGTDEKCEVCQGLGAERAINYRSEDFVSVMKDVGRANLILDMVGGDYISRNIKALADDGRLVQIAFLQGPIQEINFAHVMMRRLTITGSTLRPQSDEAKAQIAQKLRNEIWPLLDAGRMRVVMDSTFDLADAAKAHARMESSAHIGKIVLRIG
ncbi:NAD(P)H-quinone oxidoreductase [Nereida sp. MMG025]|uniref:NAD(P)H-quinone oxidoreductase n=1 Tax=Nereida sp. MMG025 TaxID=2909981 RepID=UPI001F30A522|nr:NAD(P)H-quinone oxidoreductase [Nereida sp. MMG025]MCF6444312.1 NAD(P)H-quinone oxidoreductase [Nereida sp. MMG025]